MQVDYDIIKDFFFSSQFFLFYQCQRVEDFFTPNSTRFCGVLIKDMQVVYENIKDFFGSTLALFGFPLIDV